MTEEMLPWLMPWETVEVFELIDDTVECMRAVAEFSSIRKELRDQLKEQARKLEDFSRMYHGAVVDESLLLGLEAMAEQKKHGRMAEIMEALENHVSAYNKRK